MKFRQYLKKHIEDNKISNENMVKIAVKTKTSTMEIYGNNYTYDTILLCKRFLKCNLIHDGDFFILDKSDDSGYIF